MVDRIPRKILALLRDAREAATLKNASFAFPHDTLTASRHMNLPFTGHPDDYIKEETRLYRESWIIRRLDQVISWAEDKE